MGTAFCAGDPGTGAGTACLASGMRGTHGVGGPALSAKRKKERKVESVSRGGESSGVSGQQFRRTGTEVGLGAAQ